jgi:hypothetical protein
LTFRVRRMGDNPEQSPENSDDIKGNLQPNSQPKSRQVPATSAETFVRFHEGIENFLDQLKGVEFADSCDPVRMVQALAFPLLLCVRGREAGWLPHSVLASVAARIVDIMFNHSYGRGGLVGLFRQVQDRYTVLGKHDDFLRAVGEGTLWSALLASLSGMEESPPRQLIRQASALVTVYACKELLSVASAEHISALVQSLIIKDAEVAITDRAVKIADSFSRLTAFLSKHEDEIYKKQGGGRRTLQNANSILWSSKWGWKILPSSPAQIYVSSYINVDRAAEEHPEVQRAIDALRDAMAVSPGRA